jgi:translation initiation factor 4E
MGRRRDGRQARGAETPPEDGRAQPLAPAPAAAAPAPVPDALAPTPAGAAAPSGTVHHLMNAWRAWAYMGQDAGRALAPTSAPDAPFTIDTVEAFWGVFNAVPKASQMRPGTNLAFFARASSPVWEDPSHVGGGKWVICAPDRWGAHEMDKAVLMVLLALIGHTMEASDRVLGLTVQMRRGGNRLSIWMDAEATEADLLAVGRALKAISKVPPSTPARFTRHDAAIASKSAFGAKAALEI